MSPLQWSLLGNCGAVALASIVHPTRRKHPVDFIDEALLRLPLGLENLTAQIEEGVAHLLNLLSRRNLVELAVKVLGKYLAFISAHLTEVNKIRFVS